MKGDHGSWVKSKRTSVLTKVGQEVGRVEETDLYININVHAYSIRFTLSIHSRRETGHIIMEDMR